MEAGKFCGNSSVGRARPCQGRGREFESPFPLQYGAVAEWSCSGLQLRVRRFDSDPRLHKLALAALLVTIQALPEW